jgi:hypothetical protein
MATDLRPGTGEASLRTLARSAKLALAIGCREPMQPWIPAVRRLPAAQKWSVDRVG